MALLEQKFEEARNDGLLLPSAQASAFGNDEADNVAMPRPTKLVKRVISATPRKIGDSTPSNADVAAGAVSHEIFEAAFEQVPAINIFTQRDMDDLMKQCEISVGDKAMHWEKRVDSVSFSIIFFTKKYHNKKSSIIFVSDSYKSEHISIM